MEAVIGSGKVLDYFATAKNSLAICATHFDPLKKIEAYTGGVFQNYKVSTTENHDGSIGFPYTIERGSSEQHIALQLIDNSGITAHRDGFFNLAEKLREDVSA